MDPDEIECGVCGTVYAATSRHQFDLVCHDCCEERDFGQSARERIAAQSQEIEELKERVAELEELLASYTNESNAKKRKASA